MDILKNAFERMPEPVKEKAIAHHEAFQRLKHADEQVKLWQDEQKNAQFLFNATKKDYEYFLNRWNPNTNTLGPDPRNIFVQKDQITN